MLKALKRCWPINLALLSSVGMLELLLLQQGLLQWTQTRSALLMLECRVLLFSHYWKAFGGETPPDRGAAAETYLPSLDIDDLLGSDVSGTLACCTLCKCMC